MKRKHDVMYAEFGKDYAHTCKQCTNCVYNTRDKRYYKCLRYGDSASEATDWAIGKTACGMFDVPLEPGEYPMIKRRKRDKKQAVQINGQETFFTEVLDFEVKNSIRKNSDNCEQGKPYPQEQANVRIEEGEE